MNTKATLKLIAIFAFFTILASEETIKYARTENYNAFFPFGSTVGIYCEQEINILQVQALSSSKEIFNKVINSQLRDEFSTTYQLDMINSTTILLTINKLTSQINGTLFRYRNQKELSATIVGFNPINDVNPLCSSSYGSRFIFEDSVQSDIEMNCTSEEGDPPVMMSIYIRDGDEINDVTSISTRTVSSYLHHSKTLSFSSYFNSSFNNSVFVCNVSQQLPAPYQSYQGSCSFGPILFLPLFSVTANPSTIDFSDIRNAILRCTSNVSEVNLTWSNIPNHWKYDIKEGDTYIELNVTDTGSDVYLVDIQCVGYYGDRVIASTAHVLYFPHCVIVNNVAIYLTLVIIIIVVACVAVAFLLSRVFVIKSQHSKDTTQMDDASVDVLPGILPTEKYVNINSSSLTCDSGGYLSPCEPLQDDEQYDIVK